MMNLIRILERLFRKGVSSSDPFQSILLELSVAEPVPRDNNWVTVHQSMDKIIIIIIMKMNSEEHLL